MNSKGNRAKILRYKNKARKQSKHFRDFPDVDDLYHRKAVCKRCHCVLNDCEPSTPHGEYYHPRENKEGKPHSCPNAGQMFTGRDLEIEPFLPKKRRRALKRLGIRP
jgi:hypothetical protein